MQIILIIALVAILYFRIVKFQLVVDDLNRYAEMKRRFSVGMTLKNVWGKFSIPEFLYGFGTFGINIKLDHAFTVAIYAMVCVLIYFAFGQNNISFLAAILYAVNPINHQVSIWSNGRRYAVNIILVLLMMLIPKPFGLIAWAFTPFFQVTAISAPIVLGWWYALAIPVAFIIGYRKWKERSNLRQAAQGSEDHLKFSPSRVITIFKLFGFYMTRMVVPGDCMMTYPDLYYWGLTKDGNKDAYALNWKFYRGVAVLLFSLAAVYLLPMPQRLYFIFILLAVIQWSGVTPKIVVQHSTDRYISCAVPFVMYLVAWVAVTYFGQYALAVLALLAGYYVQGLNNIMMMYEDIRAFHRHHCYYDPGNFSSTYALAHGCLMAGNPIDAWHYCRMGLFYNPNNYKFLMLASQLSVIAGDKEATAAYLSQAKANQYLGQGNVHKKATDEIEKLLSLPMVHPESGAKERRRRQMARGQLAGVA